LLDWNVFFFKEGGAFFIFALHLDVEKRQAVTSLRMKIRENAQAKDGGKRGERSFFSFLLSSPWRRWAIAVALDHFSFSSSSTSHPLSFFNVDLGLPPPSSNQNSYDSHSHEQFTPGDESKRAFTYFVLTGGRFIYASALRLAVLKFVLSMTASADVLAMASLEVDLAKIAPGQTITVKWRGKPVFVRRRTEEDVESARAVPLSLLRDPQTDESRVVNPEWLVLVGVCTHLGCVPLPGAGDFGGWFCPCHGSHYDTSGRIRKGPAPTNLEVPEYKFLDDSTLLVG
jgi:ubiquinol-cytochrome c reductase iron-sulfur subunit